MIRERFRDTLRRYRPLFVALLVLQNAHMIDVSPVYGVDDGKDLINFILITQPVKVSGWSS